MRIEIESNMPALQGRILLLACYGMRRGPLRLVRSAPRKPVMDRPASIAQGSDYTDIDLLTSDRCQYRGGNARLRELY